MTTKMKKGIRSGEWFGCGRVITTESWEGFLKARAEYWAKRDAEQAQSPVPISEQIRCHWENYVKP